MYMPLLLPFVLSKFYGFPTIIFGSSVIYFCNLTLCNYALILHFINLRAMDCGSQFWSVPRLPTPLSFGRNSSPLSQGWALA